MFYNLIDLFLLPWVFVAMCGLSLVETSGGATLPCCAQASRCGGFSCCRAGSMCGSWVVAAYRLSLLCGMWVFLDQDQTHVSCIGRRTPIHSTTREVQKNNFNELTILILLYQVSLLYLFFCPGSPLFQPKQPLTMCSLHHTHSCFYLHVCADKINSFILLCLWESCDSPKPTQVHLSSNRLPWIIQLSWP